MKKLNKSDWLGIAAFILIFVFAGGVIGDDIDQQCEVGLARCE